MNSRTSLPAETRIVSGPYSLTWEGGAVRRIEYEGIEVIRAIYVAVRDANWGTIAGEVESFRSHVDTDQFSLDFTVSHDDDPIHFKWEGHLEGDSTGQLKFGMKGVALSSFKRNRIGFCILHPRDAQGLPCRVTYAGGHSHASQFPVTVAPTDPFVRFTGIDHEFISGKWCQLTFEGDLLQMEDQRNWTDASFKTFCTPLDLPFPVAVKSGQQIEQSLDIQLPAPDLRRPVLFDSLSDTDPREVVLELSDRKGRLPEIGISFHEGDCIPTPSQLNLIKDGQFDYLRVEINVIYGLDIPSVFAQINRLSKDLNLPIELSLSVPSEESAQYGSKIADALKESTLDLKRIIFLEKGRSASTNRCWFESLAGPVRAIYSNPIGSGTEYNFAELNRNRPPSGALDFICFGISPQVHAFDEASILETTSSYEDIFLTIDKFAHQTPVFISPITLKPRKNPVATTHMVARENSLPASVDPRQRQVFAAIWAACAIRELALAGCKGACFGSMTGWQGLMETPNGSLNPELFPSKAGEVFPIYYVLHQLLTRKGAVIRRLTSKTFGNVISGMLMTDTAHEKLIIWNATTKPSSIHLPVRFLSNSPVRVWTLTNDDQDSAGFRWEESFACISNPFKLSAQKICLVELETAEVL